MKAKSTQLSVFCDLKKSYIRQLTSGIQQRSQWKDLDKLTLASHAEIQLTALVEVGEVALCGSTGGYDLAGGQDAKNANYSIVQRANHILENQHRL